MRLAMALLVAAGLLAPAGFLAADEAANRQEGRGNGQETLAGGPPSLRPLFADESILDLSLEGPLEATFDDRKAREERPFILRLSEPETPSIPLEVRIRGKSRAVLCTLAPLRLNFDSEGTKNTLFEGQDKLKLVLPCHDSDRAERDLLEEYAAYRIFGLLSDTAYRVRLLHLRLIDAGDPKGEPVLQRHAFLLESSEELSVRTGLPGAGLSAIRRGDLDAEQAARMFIFQYLIGNTDWSLIAAEGETFCCHNVRLFGAAPAIGTVPFDFDQSGLVDARYAKPDPSLHLRNVRHRRYRGYCIEPAALGAALDQAVEARQQILAVPGSLPMVSERQVRSMVHYLEDFFEQAADRDRLLEQFKDRCL